MKKTFVFDLDGTIVHDNKKISENLIKVFSAIELKGHNLVFATSRSIRGVASVLPQKFMSNIIIYCNGAFVTQDSKLIFQDYIEREIWKDIICSLDAKKYAYYLELGNKYYHPNDIEHPFYNILAHESSDQYEKNINRITDKAVYKIALLSKVNNDIINLNVKYIDTIKLYVYENKSADIVSCSCSKWNAIANLFNIYNNIIIAFGNDSNDYEMLQNANVSVAVSPSNKDIENIANIILTDKNENTLIKIIDQLIAV